MDTSCIIRHNFCCYKCIYFRCQKVGIQCIVRGVSVHSKIMRNTETIFPAVTMLFLPLQCAPGGRSDEDAQKVLIVGNVQQIGEDPILAFDGF